MKILDIVSQCILSILALFAMNLLVFHDSPLLSLAYAASVVSAFWFGRISVRMIRRLVLSKAAGE